MDLMKSLNFTEVYDMSGGINNWETNGLPLVYATTSPTTQPPTTSQTLIQITKTATLLNSTPTDTNREQIQQAVLDLFVPEFKPVQELIPILMTITNPTSSQWNHNIPITFTNVDDESEVVIWMINIALDIGETNEVLVWGITMGEGRWKVKVGFKTRIVLTS